MRVYSSIGNVLLIGLALTPGGGWVARSQGASNCPANQHDQYPRKKILKQLAETLNRSIPEYRSLRKKGFYVDKNERPGGFFIHDLSDISNKQTTPTECIKLIDGHVYHFAPITYPYSFSHIAFLKNGRVTVFRSVNCSDRGDSIEDVIRYLEQNLPAEKDKAEILQRVRNYRTFGVYSRIDSFGTLQCKSDSTQ